VGDINVYQLASTVKGLTLKEIMVHLERAGIEVMSFNTLVDEERARTILREAKPIPDLTPTKVAKRPAAKAAAARGVDGKPKEPRAARPKERKVPKPKAEPKAKAAKPAKPAAEPPELLVELIHAAPAAPPAEAAKPVEVALPPAAAPAPPEAPAPPAPPAPPAARPAPEPLLEPAKAVPPAAAPPSAAGSPVPKPPAPPREAPARAEQPARPAAPSGGDRPPVPPPPAPPRPVPPRAAGPRAAVEPPKPQIGVAPKEASLLQAARPIPEVAPPPPPPRETPLRPAAPGRGASAAAAAAPPQGRATVEPPAPAGPRPPIRIPEAITVKELAKRLEVSAGELMKRLIKMGVMATINQSLELATAKAVAAKFGLEVEAAPAGEQVQEVGEVEDPVLLRPRAPVITVMGHVDHGKTSLLDAIRHTNVMATEAGGITQHIGAYQVEVPGHAVDRVVFLDTPGHEAFTAMRARGAQVTDIVVLVVAADDGVMPQTVEAINHAKAAKVPMLVAVNKIDKPDADQNRVKQQLADLGLIPEEWGGDTIYVPVSAKRRDGIGNLLDNLLVLAEVQELKANPAKPARGTVIEAHLDKGRGPVATVLVQQGTLRVGEAVVAGLHHGRVRALLNDKGRKTLDAGPATPVELLGLSGVPMAGDIFAVAGDERKARTIALARQAKAREEAMAAQRRVTLADLHRQIAQGEVKELPIILKVDVQGSIEAVKESLEKLSTEAVKLRVIHDSVGAITETDVMLASASNAIIVGFNVRPAAQAAKLAEQERVDVRLHTVIYQAIDEIRSAMVGLLEPKFVEKVLGRVDVRNTFNITRVGTVAGTYVAEGKVARDGLVRVVRDGRVVYTGKIGSLRRFKEDVAEVAAGYECGVGIANFNDVKVGDVIEVYQREEVAAQL